MSYFALEKRCRCLGFYSERLGALSGVVAAFSVGAGTIAGTTLAVFDAGLARAITTFWFAGFDALSLVIA